MTNEIAGAAREVQRCFPDIYLACHVRHARARSSPRGLSSQDSMYLGHLHRKRPVSPGGLARHLGVAGSTVSAFLKRMEDLGYVARERSATDGRETVLRLTPDGDEARRAASILDTARLERILSQLSAPDRRLVVQGLGKLAEACRGARAQYESSGPSPGGLPEAERE